MVVFIPSYVPGGIMIAYFVGTAFILVGIFEISSMLIASIVIFLVNEREWDLMKNTVNPFLLLFRTTHCGPRWSLLPRPDIWISPKCYSVSVQKKVSAGDPRFNLVMENFKWEKAVLRNPKVIRIRNSKRQIWILTTRNSWKPPTISSKAFRKTFKES